MEYSAPLSLDRNIHAILTKPVCLSAIQVYKNILPKKKEIACHIYIYTMKPHGIDIQKVISKKNKNKEVQMQVSKNTLYKKAWYHNHRKKPKIRSKKRREEGVCVHTIPRQSLCQEKKPKNYTNLKNKNAVSARLPLYIVFSLHAFCNSLQSGAVLGGDKVCTANVCPANTV